MNLRMRHFAILAAAAVTIAAMAFDKPIESLTAVYGIFTTVILADKANSMRTSVTES